MNVELAERVLEHIQNLPEGDVWDQAEWFERTECGTACCFAGWAVALDCGLKGRDLNLHLGNTWISGEARVALDISLDQSAVLFCATNSLRRLKALVKEMS